MVGADYDKLRSVLDVNLRRVSYDGATSLVSSVYFDDWRLSSYHDNVDGVGRRFKLRLRWYDSDTGRSCFFEIKRRVDLMVEKWRIELESDVPLHRIPYAALVRSLGSILPSGAAELLACRPEPILISEYRRDYYEAVGVPLRVTLDRHLVSYRQDGASSVTKRFGHKSPDALILEAKSPPGEALSLREWLHPLVPSVTKFSKYAFGVQQLGLTAER